MKTHSLLELTKSIEQVIARTYSKTYWVRAEILTLNHYTKSGHCYPELVEKQHGEIVAEIRSTIWKSKYQQLSKKFQQETGVELKAGISVLFLVSVHYSSTHGITLNVHNIDPSYTLGALAKEKLESIEKLKKEHLFERNQQLLLPTLPSKIAIISVATSKGYSDFEETILQKGSKYPITTHLFPAILQGDAAVKSIISQFQAITQSDTDYQVIMIIRGGGGDVGLHCYNNYELAKTIASSPIPVLTGIGHSTNLTVCELVAHTNKITPTALADWLIQKFVIQEDILLELSKTIVQHTQNQLAIHQQKLKDITSKIQRHFNIPLRHELIRLQRIGSKLEGISLQQISHQLHTLSQVILPQIDQASKKTIHLQEHNLALLEQKLQLLNPAKILERGYTITTQENGMICNFEELSVGQQITTHSKLGKVESSITKIALNEK